MRNDALIFNRFCLELRGFRECCDWLDRRSRGFDFVEAFVGFFHQRPGRGVFHLREGRDADGKLGLVLQPQRLGEVEDERLQSAGNGPCAGLGTTDQQYDQLVSAQTECDVGCAERRADDLADVAEQFIAGGVAERVVEDL